MEKNKQKIIFMGTSEFAVPVLKKLIKNYQVISVFTQPDKPIGRKKELSKSPIKKVAQENNLKIIQPKSLKDEKVVNQIRELNPDLIIVVAYGQIIPQKIIKISKFGIMNIHPSLLPKYRGASPIQTAIMNGEKETGVTIMLIDEKMDHGPILAQEKINIGDDNYIKLSEKLSEIGANLLIKILPDYFSGKINPQEQDHTKATFTKIITREDGQIDWHKSAKEIGCQFRAFTPWPGVFTFWNNKRLKITKLTISEINKQDGLVFLTSDEEVAIGCGMGSIIISKLQLEGKKEMRAKEFILGYPDFIGSRLW